VRPNWQRPMRLLLDEIFTDPNVDDLLRRLNGSRRSDAPDIAGEMRSG